MKFIPETIGDAVMMYVRQNYRSNKEAAREFGISQSHLSGIIGGTKRPPDQVLRAMGVALVYAPSESIDSRMFPFERRISTKESSHSQHVGAAP
jgi:methylmalonyl-CoA mutase cobalamin-binding subunit